eukprot:gene1004-1274_t
MNGIIHACSQEFAHSLLPFSEEELIRKVCNYVDKLFHNIRPRKLFYMAIDGVAPRSKMNQQRQRRFLSVHNDALMKKKLEMEGKPIPDVIFNSTAITPGTEFMSNLSEYLQFYIKKKISEDLSWREVQIIFSGPENPGEGEHKIIDYIRKNKASPDWDPNQTHCLYGLDADLILLGLVTHEPNFSILREEIVFKSPSSTTTTKKQLDFQLLHLSILREYLDLELRNESLEFGYDLERIIDDFVLIMIFFGNDFVPHLPFFEISKSGLNKVMEIYKQVLPELGGYLTDGAHIDLDRLEIFLVHLTKFELSLQNLGDAEELDAEEESEVIKDLTEDFILEHDSLEEDERKKLEEMAIERLKSHFVSDFTENPDEEADLSIAWQNSYYRQFFPNEFPDNKEEQAKFKQRMVKSFVEGLSWVLNYYHNGCISWTWYYPFLYAPLAADFGQVSQLAITFEPGQPVTPFQQLLSVLPPQSAFLLPKCYQPLMTDPTSPIIDFYPTTFEIDTQDSHYFNGVASINFIDHDRLVAATETIPKDPVTGDSFTDQERYRNSLRNAVIIYHDDDVDVDVESPNPNVFPDLKNSSATTEDFILPHYDNGLRPFRYCEGALVGAHSPSGFPTFESQKFTFKFVHGVVNIWGFPSRKDSLIITPPRSNDTIKTLKSLIGKQCYVNWPYLEEGLITGFSDKNERITKSHTHELTTVQKISFLDQVKTINSSYLKKGLNLYPEGSDENEGGNHSKNNNNKSTPSNNNNRLDFENCHTILVHVRKLVGVDTFAAGRTKKRYSDEESIFPTQLMISYDAVRSDSRFEELEEMPFEKRFPVGKQVLFTNKEYYGSIGTVQQLYDDQIQIKLKVNTEMDWTFGHRCSKLGTEYFSIQQVSKLAQLPISHLSLLTGGLFISKPMIDIGLNMKFTGRQQQVLGYCQCIQTERNGSTVLRWEFSNKAIELILDYLKTFPKLVNILQLFDAKSNDPMSTPSTPSTPAKRSVDINPLFKDTEEKNQFLKSVEEYLEASGIRKKRVVPIGTTTLERDIVTKIEQHYGELSKNAVYQEIVVTSTDEHIIEPYGYESIISHERHIYKSQIAQKEKKTQSGSPQVRPQTPTKVKSYFDLFQPRFHLGDRVVTILDKGNVPFGLYGTVVSVQEQKVDVIFDQECFSGTSLEGFCSEKRGICISKMRLYNISAPPPKKPKHPTIELGPGFIDITSDPADFWEKLSLQDSPAPSSPPTSFEKRERGRKSQNTSVVEVSSVVSVANSATTNETNDSTNSSNPAATSSSAPSVELNWQQKQLLESINNKNQNNNNTTDHQVLKQNYLMKKHPTYVKQNYSTQEVGQYTKKYPKLPHNYFYDQNDNPIPRPQNSSFQKNQQLQQQQQTQPQQPSNQNQPPQQQDKKRRHPRNKQVQQQPQQPVPTPEPIDPQKQRAQRQLDLIYQNMEPNSLPNIQSNQNNSGDSDSAATNLSTQLLIQQLFESQKVVDQSTQPPPGPHPHPPHGFPIPNYLPPPPHMAYPYPPHPHAHPYPPPYAYQPYPAHPPPFPPPFPMFEPQQQHQQQQQEEQQQPQESTTKPHQKQQRRPYNNNNHQQQQQPHRNNHQNNHQHKPRNNNTNETKKGSMVYVKKEAKTENNNTTVETTTQQ